ncbi:MAG: YdcF family protein [Candidatus Eremiobacterota bacterium]
MNRRRLKKAALAVAFFFLIQATWITAAGMKVDLRRADCIVVPGARVCSDGTLGPSLQARVNHAIELQRQGWARALVFTGGQGASGAIESESAREYALRHGLPAQVLFVEVRSHNTWENFLFAREVMREQGFRSCLVTTDPFHTKRCLMIAHDLGIPAYPAPTFQGPAWRRPQSFAFYTARECLSMLKYAVERVTR